MSAHQQMRKMLDELMGTCRNGENSHREELHFTSNRVCKNFLLNCCPHEILANTRFNLGRCPKIHDVALKSDFQKSRKFEYEFQVEAYQKLNDFIVECNRRAHIAKLRLATAQDALTSEKSKQIDYLNQIDEKINEKIKKAEEMGVLGDVEESLKIMEEVDLLKSEKSKIATDFRNSTPASHDQQKKLRICEVCTSYLGLNDDDRRLADHFTGKLHLGFLYIKEKFEELKNMIQDKYIKAALEIEFQSAQNLKRCLSSTLEATANSHEDAGSSKRQKTDAVILNSQLKI